ncbi:MAG TPA: mechanosensitive ion channel family protein [Candidatus Eubacterium faecavium]|nr:mechanosensitive ion channel family protein [Candidatus Eubacterium faecavium]
MPAAVTEFFEQYSFYINIALGAAVFIALTALRNKIADLLLKILAKLFFAKKPERREGFISSLKRPVAFYFIVLGAFIGVMINYRHSAIVGTFKIISILFACWCVISFVSDNLEAFLGSKSQDPRVNNIAVKFISNILKVLTVCIAIVMVISELGYNINGLLTGLGVGGLAVSLAAQDSIKSIISGFVIMFDRPFDVGDFIETNEFSGTVEDITMRSTRVRKLDDTIIVVPNTIIADDLITNYAKLNKRLVDMKIGLLYSTTDSVLHKCINEINTFLENHAKVENESIRVRFVEFDDSSLNIQIRCYVDITGLEDYYAFCEELNFEIKRIVDDSETDFAYPTSSIFIENKNKCDNV